MGDQVPLNRLNNLAYPISLAVVVVLTGLSSLSAGFSLDDYWILYELNEKGVQWIGNWVGESTFFRPLVSLSYSLDFLIFAHNAVGFHAVNLSLHLITTLILFSILRTLSRFIFQTGKSLRAGLPAFLLALFFSLHPANAHDVAWIPGRTDLLSGLFTSLSVLFFVNSLVGRRHAQQLLSLGFFVCALASKEVAVIVPVIIAGISAWALLERGANTRTIVHGALTNTVPFIVISIVYGLFRLVYAPYSEGTLDWFAVPGVTAFLTFSKSFLLYLSPFEPIEVYYFYRNMPAFFFVALIAGAVPTLYLSIQLRRSNKRYFDAAAALLVVGMLAGVTPSLIHGWISQRIMYVPLILFALLLLPLLILLARWSADRGPTLKFVLNVIVAGLLGINATVYIQTMNEWKSASALEAKLAREILDRHENGNPIVIMTAPLRVGQVFVSSTFEYVLGYFANNRFSKLDSVYTAVHLIAPSFEELRPGITLVGDSSGLSYTISTTQPGQFLFLNVVGLRARYGVAVIDVEEGEILENENFVAKVINTSDVGRAAELQVRAKDDQLLARSELYGFQENAMRRIW